ncbi:MAG: DUF4139 domain-containing protein [Treponema sp.]|jgi:hypothetical protein|nr:DUF4139 domain-containing protein [Treponema sp.]
MKHVKHSRHSVLFLKFVMSLVLITSSFSLYAQPIQEGTSPAPASAAIPAAAPAPSPAPAPPAASTTETTPFVLNKLALFSSGVGFFEHSGVMANDAEIVLAFSVDAINDVLKSLAVSDLGSRERAIVYPVDQPLDRALQSLKIDLSGNPSVARILNGLKGEEVDVYAPNLISGRIIAVEGEDDPLLRYATGVTGNYGIGPAVTLYTNAGVKVVRLSEVLGFAFKNQTVNDDLNRALDLIMASSNTNTRNLTIQLKGNTTRKISISYVIPAAVWKASYRLDLVETPNAAFQGWAIVDNDSDMDWNNIQLSLVTGRPVSFIQELYAPYHVNRPIVPLAIAGTAEPATYESGRSNSVLTFNDSVSGTGYERAPETQAARAAGGTAPKAASLTAAIDLITPHGQDAAEQFEFTFPNAVSIPRQQSAMLPLVETRLEVTKTLIFPATAPNNRTIHPLVGAELINKTRLTLPAGPITVYDGGTYAGDALVDSFPPNEKRLISHGEDLAVNGSVSMSSSSPITTVTISQGVMTINRSQDFVKTYTFKNASAESKRLVLEHPITSGARLVSPTYTERTDTVYRFTLTLAPGQELSYEVKEERPAYERITLGRLQPETLLSYSTNGEIPANARTSLQKAVELRQALDNANTALVALKTERERVVTEQQRVREILSVVGNTGPQGEEYLGRLVSYEGNLDSLSGQIKSAEETLRTAQTDYNTYLANLSL